MQSATRGLEHNTSVQSATRGLESLVFNITQYCHKTVILVGHTVCSNNECKIMDDGSWKLDHGCWMMDVGS